MTKLGKQWPDLFLPYPAQPDMSQHIAQPIPSGLYQQEYCTIVINTPISGPMLLVASDGESCPPFIEPSFLQTSSPVSTIPNSSPISVPPTVPSSVDSAHQHELFKWLQNLPIWGYLTSTTNSEERSNPIPKVRLPPIEPVTMYELYEMLNDPAWHHIFLNAINLMGNNHDLLSCLIIVSILLSDLKQKQKPNGLLPRTSLRGWNFSRSMRSFDRSSSWNMDGYIRRSRPIGLGNIWDIIIYSSTRILIPPTIKINIAHCSNHYVQLQGVIYNCSQHSGMPRESSTTRHYYWLSWYCRFSTAPYPATFNTSSSPLRLPSWSTMPLSTSSRTDLCCRKQFWWLGWKPQIICSPPVMASLMYE